MTAFLRMIPVSLMLVLAVPLLAADRHTVPPAPVETFTAVDAPTYQGDGEWTIPWGYNRPENAQRTYPLVVIGRHNESRYFTTEIRKSYPAFFFIRDDLANSMNNEGDGQELADIIDARMDSHGYRIDTTRIYMTGWSAGGNTTYRIANGLSSRGKCFAALIRIAGQETLTLAPATNGRISVWYHIGLLDTSNNRIPVARGHYASIKNNSANAGAVETTVVNDNLIGLGQLEVLAGGGYGEWFFNPAAFGGHGRQTTKSLSIDGVPFARLSEYDIQGHETEMAYADPGLYAWLFARGIGSGPSGPIGLSVSSLSVPEGATATFTVALRAQPAAATTVTVARTDGDASITVSSGATLTFTTANWSTPQIVTLAAAQDGDVAKGTASITVSAAGLGSRTLCAIEADDDTFGIVLGNNALSVREGTTATVAVSLSAQPLANTTVTIMRGGDADLTISGATSLTFTPANWQTPQYFTIAAAQDTDTVNGSGSFGLYISGTTFTNTLLVSELDDDAVGLVINTAALSVREGSTATCTVALSAQPAATATVATARTAGDADITVSNGSSLIFTTANWSTPQAVTLAAAQDADLLNGTATITISAAGLTSRTLAVIEADDDAGSVTNNAPTISAIADQNVAHNTATGTLAFTVGDAETNAGSLTVTRSSSNPTLAPVANIVLGGSGADRTVTVTPATGQSGTVIITITVSDGSLSVQETFLLTVASAANTAPTISAIADQNVAHNTATGALAFTVGDAETNAGSLTVTRSSSNPTLAPVANIVLGGSGADRTVTVTPVTGQSGTATITITVSDGSLSVQETFLLTVASAANTAPTISAIPDQNVAHNTATSALVFTVGDAETTAGSLTVTRSSSNPTLAPVANIVLGGSGADRTVTVTPATGQSGTATITITVSDGLLSVQETFLLTVATDTTPPVTPSAPTASSTTSATPTLSGTTEAGAMVRIYDNGSQIGSVVANGAGAWSWTVNPALAVGNHSLTVIAIDMAGNASAASAATVITVASSQGGGVTVASPATGSCGAGALGLVIAMLGLTLVGRRRY